MNQKKFLIVAVTLGSLVIGVSISLFVINNPSSTIVTPPPPNPHEYVCPEGQPASVCSQLKLTCGNGIADPGEDCRNCGFDMGCPSGLICGDIMGSEDYICHYPAGLCSPGPGG